MKNKIILILLFILIQSNIAFSENATIVQEQDFFSQIGKIYVVVGVILIIFIGLIINMIRLDRKISAVERDIERELKAQ